MNHYVLNLRVHGMFSNVNEVIQQLYLAEQNGYSFEIKWESSCYSDQHRKQDPWLYFFEPCFDSHVLPEGESLKPLKGGVVVACTKDNIITPRREDGICNPLLLPKERQTANRIIKKYLVLNKAVRDEISAFKQAKFGDYVIGLHIRGQGRNHGGAAALRAKHELEDGIPYSLYFQNVNETLKHHPNSQIFICSDSEKVIRRVSQEYGDKVISYHSTRSEFGEMHANHPKNKGMQFSGYKLGLDVLVEAYLLSEVDFYIHGNSNVANFVLCNNLDVPSIYVYS